MARRKHFKGKQKQSYHGRKQDKRPSAEIEERATNDYEWYAQTPELLRDAASLPFSFATGTTYSLGISDVLTSEFSGIDQTVPGIMTLEIAPIPGYAHSPNAPINIAATSQYSFVRHANSGHANYDAPDLMLYMLAMGNIYSYINFLQRVYGTAMVYTHQNRYLPRALVNAQKVDFDDVYNNLANFRYGINVLIHQAASLACPANMTYFRRLAFLFSSVYAEGESAKSQLYMYVPDGFLKFQETALESGGHLSYVPLLPGGTNTLLKVDDLLNYGRSLLSPILASEDMNIMSGDILKAYGANILKLEMLPEVYTIAPVTNLDVLEQFQNARWLGVRPTSIAITQDTNMGSLNIDLTVNSPMYEMAASTKKHLLNTILVSPGPGDVIERTRLKMGVVVQPAHSGQANPYSYIYGGSEICLFLKYYKIDPQDPTSAIMYEVSPTYTVNNITPNISELAAQLKEHCALENFKFHPMKYYFNGPQTSSQTTVEELAQAIDMDNYTVFDNQLLEKMNEAALLSLFNVNSVAKF